MDISSLTTVTSSATRNGTDSTSASTASAPFAEVMQRVASDKPSRSGDGASNPAQTSSPNSAQAAPVEATPLSVRDESRSDQTANGVAAGATSQAATDARQILQALASGDMSSLHGALASLADEGSRAEGKFGTADHAQLKDMLGDDANALAAMVAALPQAVATPAGDNAALSSSAGDGLPGASQGMLRAMILTTTDETRGQVALPSNDLAGDGNEMPGMSSRVNAPTLQPSAATAISVMNTNAGSALAGTGGQALPTTDASVATTLGGGLADITTGTRHTPSDLTGLDVSMLSNGRNDVGLQAGSTSSLSTAPGAVTNAATPANPTITASVQSPQWPASFGQQVLQMHQRGDQQMSLRIHPQELGPLSVSLTVQDQQAHLQILSAHAPVRAAVEAAMPQLRQALADSGIALGEAMVGDQGMFQQGQPRQGDSSRDDGSPRAIGALFASDVLDTGAPDSGDELTSRQIAITANGNISLYA